MLKLLTLPAAFGVRSASPFALKAEMLLAVSGLPFDIEPSVPRRGPRGKMPVLVDGGAIVPDTRNIQHHLETHRGVSFDGHLTPEDRANGTAIRRLCEEHLYWASTHVRWTEQPERLRDAYFAEVPWPLRGLVFSMVRRQVRRDLWGQGLGRMTRDEILRLAAEDLASLRNVLGAKPFLFGERLSSFDLTAAALLVNILAPGAPTSLTPLAEPLRGYAEGVERAVFGRVWPESEAGHREDLGRSPKSVAGRTLTA